MIFKKSEWINYEKLLEEQARLNAMLEKCDEMLNAEARERDR